LNAVRNRLGSTIITRTPNGATSAARDSDQPSNANFEEQ
jgi:hypothetical protein